MISKTKIISLDLKKLAFAVTEQIKPPQEIKTPSIRSTIFSIGSDSRVGSVQLSTPNLFLIEILRDSLKQLYIRINWKIPRFDIDSGKIIGFNVYRRRLSTFFDKKLTSKQFEKLTANLKKNGEFSEQKKGIFNVKRGTIPQNSLNSNIKIQENQEDAGFSLPKVNNFEKIAFVDYTQFIGKEKLKTVFSVDSENISIFYEDLTVGLGEEYDYFVSAVSSYLEETFQSETIHVFVEDNEQISPPEVLVKQINENSILLNVTYKKQDQIDDVIIYRQEIDNDSLFVKIAELKDVDFSAASFLDEKAFFGKEFIYRIFVRNIHGVLSPPKEIKFFSSTNIQKSQSNNIRQPVFNAIQQKNIARLVISPNDTKILFYKIDRRDLFIDERKFIVPSKETNGYGGNGWSSNQIFYDRINPVPVEFIDDTVSAGHVYQYRIAGEDRFGNKSSNSYQTIEIIKQELLKSPINIGIQTLRENPLRIKLTWDDANEYTGGVIPLFEIHRRTGHNSFASFPLTENRFLIDEVYTDDAVQFSRDKIDDIYVPSPDKIIQKKQFTGRSNGILDFLKENLFYFYRVKVLTSEGSFSPFSEEMKLSTFQSLASPINFIAVNENPKIKPITVHLSWDIQQNKFLPDRFIIQRKTDNVNDVFANIGNAYFENEFFDRNIRSGNYLYRIKSMDASGRETDFIETRISV